MCIVKLGSKSYRVIQIYKCNRIYIYNYVRVIFAGHIRRLTRCKESLRYAMFQVASWLNRAVEQTCLLTIQIG